ncbi:hypothetical protein [Marinobacterium rhizophilum]|uniref:Uncharacterized protein n=1 Tax=Marinobacterium rhizophilum TaxID=420402 RepID=A0ABY5HN60_9GAMM|nr:hypothetical protein [Marinobacterium rhizophilum]UTW13750.1 hypothetical protein KDW95_08960 [Marinobacterium rhizophilum]
MTEPLLSQQAPCRRSGATAPQLAGWLLFAAALSSIAGALGGPVAPQIPGALAWSAGLLLFSRLGGIQRIQVMLMLGLGGSGLLLAAYQGELTTYGAQALANSQVLIAMLVGVGFLRLVALPATAGNHSLPRGRASLCKTLLGTHLFGAAINFSALTIIGDRLHSERPLTPLQALVLSRGFGLAALWSPFFVAMGVALTLAPGAGLLPLSLSGLAVAVPALLLAGYGLTSRRDSADFAGYPVQLDALRIPLSLVLLVIAGHQLLPWLGILSLITICSLTLPLLLLLHRSHGDGVRRYRQHIEQALPGMHGELLLFLAAGVLMAGISALVHFSGIRLSLQHFGATEAAGLVGFSALLAIVGIHPVISVSSLAGMLMPVVTDPNLLGLAILMSWSLGVIVSPCSGTHLAMQGRFGINCLRFFGWNWRFALGLYGLDCLVLFGYEALFS